MDKYYISTNTQFGITEILVKKYRKWWFDKEVFSTLGFSCDFSNCMDSALKAKEKLEEIDKLNEVK